jgi:hypothetical protein
MTKFACSFILYFKIIIQRDANSRQDDPKDRIDERGLILQIVIYVIV